MSFSIRLYRRFHVISKFRQRFAMKTLVYCLTLTACASTPTLSRDEWLSMTNRTYDGVTKEQTISAAERLLRLADGNDFMIAHGDDGFIATCHWMVYLILAVTVGTDSWMIRAVENGHGGTRVSVSVGTQAGSVTGVATGSNTAAPLTMPSMGGSVNGTAIYDVFWARMDYLLGRRQVWMTCHAANKKVSAGLVWGDNSALCNDFNIKDDMPEGAITREPESREMEKKRREEEIRQNSY